MKLREKTINTIAVMNNGVDPDTEFTTASSTARGSRGAANTRRDTPLEPTTNTKTRNTAKRDKNDCDGGALSSVGRRKAVDAVPSEPSRNTSTKAATKTADRKRTSVKKSQKVINPPLKKSTQNSRTKKEYPDHTTTMPEIKGRTVGGQKRSATKKQMAQEAIDKKQAATEEYQQRLHQLKERRESIVNKIISAKTVLRAHLTPTEKILYQFLDVFASLSGTEDDAAVSSTLRNAMKLICSDISHENLSNDDRLRELHIVSQTLQTSIGELLPRSMLKIAEEVDFLESVLPHLTLFNDATSAHAPPPNVTPQEQCKHHELRPPHPNNIFETITPVGREAEAQVIRSFVTASDDALPHPSLLLFGLPGTGKTAVVKAVMVQSHIVSYPTSSLYPHTGAHLEISEDDDIEADDEDATDSALKYRGIAHDLAGGDLRSIFELMIAHSLKGRGTYRSADPLYPAPDQNRGLNRTEDDQQPRSRFVVRPTVLYLNGYLLQQPTEVYSRLYEHLIRARVADYYHHYRRLLRYIIRQHCKKREGVRQEGSCGGRLARLVAAINAAASTKATSKGKMDGGGSYRAARKQPSSPVRRPLFDLGDLVRAARIEWEVQQKEEAEWERRLRRGGVHHINHTNKIQHMQTEAVMPSARSRSLVLEKMSTKRTAKRALKKRKTSWNLSRRRRRADQETSDDDEEYTSDDDEDEWSEASSSDSSSTATSNSSSGQDEESDSHDLPHSRKTPLIITAPKTGRGGGRKWTKTVRRAPITSSSMDSSDDHDDDGNKSRVISLEREHLETWRDRRAVYCILMNKGRLKPQEASLQLNRRFLLLATEPAAAQPSLSTSFSSSQSSAGGGLHNRAPQVSQSSSSRQRQHLKNSKSNITDNSKNTSAHRGATPIEGGFLLDLRALHHDHRTGDDQMGVMKGVKRKRNRDVDVKDRRDVELSGEQVLTGLRQTLQRLYSTRLCFIVVDEMDRCCSTGGSGGRGRGGIRPGMSGGGGGGAAAASTVLYRLCEWLTYPNCHCRMVCIANAMQLPERLDTRTRSRLNTTHRLVFPAYTEHQLRAILTARLSTAVRANTARCRDKSCDEKVNAGETKTIKTPVSVPVSCRILALLPSTAAAALSTPSTCPFRHLISCVGEADETLCKNKTAIDIPTDPYDPHNHPQLRVFTSRAEEWLCRQVAQEHGDARRLLQTAAAAVHTAIADRQAQLASLWRQYEYELGTALPTTLLEQYHRLYLAVQSSITCNAASSSPSPSSRTMSVGGKGSLRTGVSCPRSHSSACRSSLNGSCDSRSRSSSKFALLGVQDQYSDDDEEEEKEQVAYGKRSRSWSTSAEIIDDSPTASDNGGHSESMRNYEREKDNRAAIAELNQGANKRPQRLISSYTILDDNHSTDSDDAYPDSGDEEDYEHDQHTNTHEFSSSSGSRSDDGTITSRSSSAGSSATMEGKERTYSECLTSSALDRSSSPTSPLAYFADLPYPLALLNAALQHELSSVVPSSKQDNRCCITPAELARLVNLKRCVQRGILLEQRRLEEIECELKATVNHNGDGSPWSEQYKNNDAMKLDTHTAIATTADPASGKANTTASAGGGLVGVNVVNPILRNVLQEHVFDFLRLPSTDTCHVPLATLLALACVCVVKIRRSTMYSAPIGHHPADQHTVGITAATSTSLDGPVPLALVVEVFKHNVKRYGRDLHLPEFFEKSYRRNQQTCSEKKGEEEECGWHIHWDCLLPNVGCDAALSSSSSSAISLSTFPSPGIDWRKTVLRALLPLTKVDIIEFSIAASPNFTDSSSSSATLLTLQNQQHQRNSKQQQHQHFDPNLSSKNISTYNHQVTSKVSCWEVLLHTDTMPLVALMQPLDMVRQEIIAAAACRHHTHQNTQQACYAAPLPAAFGQNEATAEPAAAVDANGEQNQCAHVFRGDRLYLNAGHDKKITGSWSDSSADAAPTWPTKDGILSQILAS